MHNYEARTVFMFS